jgi:hypothetical protein
VSAWISTTDHGVVDISEYIVSGSVTRNINEVSTAELTIRNPDKKWTDPPGEPTFRPMDGITIWMNRFKSRPVQVFTGYLDSTPYLQLHPGACSLSASCTLKRLLYTYFDPGLPYTRTWLRQYDWIVDSTTGQAKNINAQQTDKRQLPARLTDGGIGDLLYGTLADIGNWDDKHIKIEEVPRDLAKTLERIQDSFRTDKDKARKQLEDFLQKMIGNFGGPGSGASPGGPLTGGTNAHKIFNYFAGAEFSDEAAAGVVGNFQVESNCDPKAYSGDSGYNAGFTGIAQWSPSRWASLENFANQKNKDKWSLGLQLDYVVYELNNGYEVTRDYMRKGGYSPEDHALHFCKTYEAPDDCHDKANARPKNAREAYDSFSGKKK